MTDYEIIIVPFIIKSVLNISMMVTPLTESSKPEMPMPDAAAVPAKPMKWPDLVRLFVMMMMMVEVMTMMKIMMVVMTIVKIMMVIVMMVLMTPQIKNPPNV